MSRASTRTHTVKTIQTTKINQQKNGMVVLMIIRAVVVAADTNFGQCSTVTFYIVPLMV